MLFLFISYVRIDELYGQKPKYKLYSAEERRFKVAEEGGGRRRRGYNNRPSGMTGGMWADSEGGRGRGWYVQHILLWHTITHCNTQELFKYPSLRLSRLQLPLVRDTLSLLYIVIWSVLICLHVREGVKKWIKKVKKKICHTSLRGGRWGLTHLFF